MYAYELELHLPPAPAGESLLRHLEREATARLDDGLVPLRIAVTRSGEDGYDCEVGVLADVPEERRDRLESIFSLTERHGANARSFVTVFVVPTGIGAEVGGHAGDATPAARLLAAVSDTLVTHPNVVNASDVMELPENGLYVEGSMLARFLLGTVGLRRVRANRVLTVADDHTDGLFVDMVVNSVNGARATFGLASAGIALLDPPLPTEAVYATSGRATGKLGDLDRLVEMLERRRREYDAVALSTQVKVPFEYHHAYFSSGGAMVNPWGGAEALLTHSISMLLGVPAAHSPMDESRQVLMLETGRVDPRIAAEAISSAYLMCVLKGLQHSPEIVADAQARLAPDVVNADDVSVLVTPDGAVGLPLLAALEQGITVIAVRESRNLMRNDLAALPWRPGQLVVVDNYWEAAGVALALREGIDPATIRRPLAGAAVTEEPSASAARLLEAVGARGAPVR